MRPDTNTKLFLRRWIILALVLIPLGFGLDWFSTLRPDDKSALAVAVVFIAIPAAAVVAFVLLVWPTLWRYEKIGSTLARIRRFDGRTEVLTPQGWRRIGNDSGIPLA